MKFYLLAIFTALTFTFSTGAHAKILFDGDFEVSKLSNYNLKASGNWPKISSTREPSCLGNKSMKVTLDRDYDRVSYRTEVTRLTDIGRGGLLKWNDIYWFSVSVFIPNNWRYDTANNGDTVIQFHNGKDLRGKYWVPPLTIKALKDQWVIDIKGDARSQVPRDKVYQQSTRKKVGSITRGKWTTFTMQLKFDYRGGGFVKAWRDGKHRFSHKGKVGFNSDYSPYLKAGLYKPRWRKPYGPIRNRTFYLDELIVADHRSSFSDVAVRCR